MTWSHVNPAAVPSTRNKRIVVLALLPSTPSSSSDWCSPTRTRHPIRQWFFPGMYPPKRWGGRAEGVLHGQQHTCLCFRKHLSVWIKLEDRKWLTEAFGVKRMSWRTSWAKWRWSSAWGRVSSSLCASPFVWLLLVRTWGQKNNRLRFLFGHNDQKWIDQCYFQWA